MTDSPRGTEHDSIVRTLQRQVSDGVDRAARRQRSRAQPGSGWGSTRTVTFEAGARSQAKGKSPACSKGRRTACARQHQHLAEHVRRHVAVTQQQHVAHAEGQADFGGHQRGAGLAAQQRRPVRKFQQAFARGIVQRRHGHPQQRGAQDRRQGPLEAAQQADMLWVGSEACIGVSG
jgi:hypothetical protein